MRRRYVLGSIPTLKGPQRSSLIDRKCLQTGVSQIRHAQPFVDHLDGGHKPPQPQETIVPSYSIDMDSPKGAQKERPEEDSLPPPVPCSKIKPIDPFPTSVEADSAVHCSAQGRNRDH